MERFEKYFVGLVLLCQSFSASAQQEVEMADTLRSEGKIYVVVAIILIILAGLFIYLFMLDRKVKRLEDQVKNNRTS